MEAAGGETRASDAANANIGQLDEPRVHRGISLAYYVR